MWEWLDRVFGQGFMPHGHCYLWAPSMVWSQVSSNFFIGLAYASKNAHHDEPGFWDRWAEDF